MSPKRMTSSGSSSSGAVAGDQVVGETTSESGRAGPSAAARSARRGSGSRRPRPAPRRARPAPASGWRPATIRPRGRRGDPLGELVEQRRARAASGSATTAFSGRSPRPSSASGSVAVTSPSTGDRRQRLAPGDVQVDRARARVAGGGGVGAAGDRAEVQQPVVVGLVGADLAEPAHGVAVELQLVDRLAGADAAQLGRAVGGEHDQRHRGLVGLDHGGVEVGGRRARGAEDDRRDAGSRAPSPSAKKPALRSSRITSTSIAGWRQSATRERGRARAGGDHGAAHAAAGELLDHRRGEGGVAVGRIHRPHILAAWRRRSCPSAPISRATSCCSRRGAWAPTASRSSSPRRRAGRRRRRIPRRRACGRPSATSTSTLPT